MVEFYYMKQTLLPINYQKLFLALPERYIVFAPDKPTYTMVGASDAYLKSVNKKRGELVGKALFDVFPDTSPLAKNTGKGTLELGLEKCLDTKKLHSLGIIRYDIPDRTGKLVLRYWNVTLYPVVNKGEVELIFQHTDDVTDMVLTSEQQKITETKFDEILATGLVGSWSWDLVSDKIRADKGLAKLFGITPEEIEAGLRLEQFLESVHPKDQARVQFNIEEALAYKESYESEYRTIGRQGQVHWVIARGRVERDSNGNPIAFPGVLIDITDRKEAEYELSQSERRLRFLVDTMPQLIWIARPDGYHEYYNARWHEFTGMPEGGTSYDERNKLLHPDDKKRAREQWAYSLRHGSSYEIEYRLYHEATDSYRWVICRAMPFHDENGKILKWYGTCTDIHDQKRNSEIQTFLAEISKQLSLTLDIDKTLKRIAKLAVPVLGDWCSFEILDEKTQLIESMAVAHRDPKKISIAKKFRSMSTVTIDQPTGAAHVIRTGEPEFIPAITEELIDNLVEDKDMKRFLLDIKLRASMTVPLFIKNKPSGAIIFISSESMRNFDEHDLEIAQDLASRVSAFLTNATLYKESIEVIAHQARLEEQLKEEKLRLEMRVQERTSQLQLTNIGLLDEIKKRQQIENELVASSKELKRSNQELQDFAYVSSHDLQEPLRKIRAFGDLLKSEYGDKLGEGGEYLDRMQNAALRMSTLIDDLLAFSRVSTKPMDDTTVNLNKIVKEVVYDLETRVRDTEAQVTINSLPMVRADEIYMRQLFQNLIGNALKFHKPGQPPVVEVSGKRHDKCVELMIRDEGIGFEEKYLDRIFAVFQRLHGRDVYEGTGIGLAVCRKIVERYGGTITATSKKGDGTTFIVRLPATERNGKPK